MGGLSVAKRGGIVGAAATFLLACVLAFSMALPAGVAIAEPSTKVDPNTTGTWENFTNPGGVTSTQNVGRIWTDKSVFNGNYTFSGSDALSGQTVNKGNDTDFLVSLSALSSTSNLKTTTTTTTPLDIVLVLDVSGSMDDSMGTTYIYTEAYPRGTQGTYYIQVNGQWTQVQYHEQSWYDDDPDGWRYNSGSWRDPQYIYVEPKTSADDGDPSHVQFYTRQQSSTDKIGALKTAANQFIASVGTMNANIADADDQHRIAIVKYADDSIKNEIGDDLADEWNGYNYTQVVSDFSTDSESLQGDIRGLNAGGATSADYGLTLAQRVLTGGEYGNYGDRGTYVGARDDAQKVVIFFTDGEPNHSSGWSGSVAATSVNLAHDMKDAGTTVYTIGVVNGADPEQNPANASDLNKYLHAVSSNYKNATAKDWRGDASWYYLNLGDRTQKDGEDANYYFAASDAEQLNQVFDDITSSITEGLGSGSPIEEITSQGNTNPGTLTFEDQLGDYMQVTGTGAGADKIQLAYGNQIYTSERKTTEGHIDTYHFADQTVGGNEVYGSAKLSDLVVKVERSTELAVGDKITVTLPASLLPMRHYDVDTDSSTMTVNEAYPVRLFYGVALKAEAKTALGTASGDVYQGILNNIKVSEDGTLDFYSNAFEQNAPNGLTTATFTPSEGNKFYYYTENTPLYVNENCTTRATSSDIVSAEKVYYADTYWQTANGTTSETMTGVEILRGGTEFDKIQYDGQGQAYMPAHTERTDRPNTLVADKGDFEGGNVTGTASSVLVPSWNDDSTVSQALGNNGKLSYPAPGDLEIKKEVDWGNASDSTKTSKNTFTFQVALANEDGTALSGTYNYAVYGAGADPIRTGTISNNDTVSITPDEHVLITGLPADAAYTVTEQGANSNGFTTTDNSTGDGANTIDGKVEGDIVAGGQQSVSFKNTYYAAPVDLSTKATLQVQKNLTGRDWRATDEFTFEIDGLRNTATGETAPEPEQTTVTVTDETSNHTAAFGDITFTKPGEYLYAITEDNDTKPIDGIDYSAARYRAIVTVTDNGTGDLVVDSVTIEQRQNDDGGVPAQQPTITNNTVVFTNNYDVNNGTTNIDGIKNYTDTTGGNPIDDDKFTFQLKAVGGFDTAAGSAGGYTIDAADVPMPAGADANHAVTTTNTGYGFGFPRISYDGNDVGKTFVYEVTELAGTETGMNYDTTTKHIVQVAVSEGEDPENLGQTVIVATPNMTPQQVVFDNTYDPTDASLDGENAIHGIKTLTGRSMLEGETFSFQLTQTGGPAADGGGFVTVLAQPETVTVDKDNMQNGSADFNFSDLKFSQVGTYTFTVNEVAVDGAETVDGSGLTYDKNICTVTVNVTDNKQGALVADVAYANQGHDETDQAVFTNTYKASMDYGAKGGINVTKQMLDRPMAEGDYTFTIVGEGEAANLVSDADVSFTNTAAAVDGIVTMDKLQNLTFDQDDAGKTFTFMVDEADPAEGQAIAGVAYDKSQYKVEITVVDNGNGTMHTVTTVTKTMNTAGEPVADVVINQANSGADNYTVPTFGFVNDYNPGSVTIGEDAGNPIQVTKTVSGAPSPDGVNYGFTLKLTSGNKAGISEGLTQEGDAWVAHVNTDGVINQDAEDGTSDDSQTVTFGNITFTEPGTYTFEVAEDAPVADDGWTFDTTPKTVTVVVSDLNQDYQYDGNLHIASVTGSPVQVTNRYEADPVVVGGDDAQQQITVKKSVTGADSTANFAFDIAAVDGGDPKWDNVEAVASPYNTQTTIAGGVTQAQSRTATFDAIRFNAEGTYQFTVTENGAAGFNAGADRKGWTYDEHTVTVTVTVDDTDYDGQLEASVGYDNSSATTDADKAETNAAAFTNTYDAGSTDVDTGTTEDGVQLTKVLTGKAWDGDSFTFEMTAVSNTAGVDVADQPMPNPATVTVNQPTSKDAHGNDIATFDFGNIKFDAPGTYKYEVREVVPQLGVPGYNAGIDYDDVTVAAVTITVKDNHDGTLSSGVAIANNEFTNTYKSELDYNGAGGLAIEKTFVGHEMDEFSFTITPTGDNAQEAADKLGIEVGGTSKTVKPGAATDTETADGTPATVADVDVIDATGEKRMFTQADEGKTYTYMVKENIPADKKPGYTYDDTEYTVTITTEDDGNGGIKVHTHIKGGTVDATYTYDNDDATEDQTAVIPFENSYNVSGELGGQGATSIVATKTLTNRPMADREFHFTVTNTADNSNTVVAHGYNDADGNITFDRISYSTQQMQKDVENSLAQLDTGDNTYIYTYTVAEDTANLDEGVAATDAAGFQIDVRVTDNGDGTLGIDVAYPGDADGLTFRNTYGEGLTGQATIRINGVKGYKTNGLAGAPDINRKFTFELTGVDEDGNPAPMPAKTTATNDRGNVDFGDITYTMENVFGDTGSQDVATNAEDAEGGIATQSAERTKTFTYTVKESGSVPGVDNDPNSTDTFTVTVTDHGDGSLSVETSPNQEHNLALFGFTNEYNVDPATSSPTVDGSLTITKNLTGRDLAEGEFTVVMTDDNDARVSQGVNDANGNIALDAITFTKPGDYVYDLYEAPGSKGGVTYDTARYKATAHVTDNGDGTMSVTWDFANAADEAINAITFNNTYEAAPTSVILGGSKVLDGRELAANEFQFQLADKDGNVLQTVANAADGGFSFDSITYDQTGTYEYVISEVKGDVEGVTYDETTYAVKVVVTDGGEGKLNVTELTYNGKAELPVFANSYTEPAAPAVVDEPEEVLPQTGDTLPTLLAGVAAVAVVALAVLGFAAFKLRRGKNAHRMK